MFFNICARRRRDRDVAIDHDRARLYIVTQGNRFFQYEKDPLSGLTKNKVKKSIENLPESFSIDQLIESFLSGTNYLPSCWVGICSRSEG